jgi:hypothetical protein
VHHLSLGSQGKKDLSSARIGYQNAGNAVQGSRGVGESGRFRRKERSTSKTDRLSEMKAAIVKRKTTPWLLGDYGAGGYHEELRLWRDVSRR